MSDVLLEVNNLITAFTTRDGKFNAVDNVSFSVKKGETLGVVGESGCGKSVTALSIMRLIPNPPGEIIHGEIWLDGENLISKKHKEMKKIRGKKVSMIFQEPMTSLNPLFTIGEQIMEVFRIHFKDKDKKEMVKKTKEMLQLVGIPDVEHLLDLYPHHLSGGMRQRVMIAMALACEPQLLIADEPTTALDVTIQAQILELMSELKQQINTSIILITHDMGVVAELADRIIVMYAGQIVENSSVNDIFKAPLHPYTEGLLNSIPRVDSKQERLKTIKGVVLGIHEASEGCNFEARCDYSRLVCKNMKPSLYEKDNREVRCFKYTDLWEKGDEFDDIQG